MFRRLTKVVFDPSPVRHIGPCRWPVRKATLVQVSPYLYNIHYNAVMEDGMLTMKITTVGASAGIILTKEAMAKLKVQKGDTLFLTDAPEGGYRLTPYDPTFARQMALAEEIMHDDRDVLRALSR